MKYIGLKALLVIVLLVLCAQLYAQDAEIVPDDTYGKGGFKKITKVRMVDKISVKIEYYDGARIPNLRQEKYEKTDLLKNTKDTLMEDLYYDCNRNLIRHIKNETDNNGNAVSKSDINYDASGKTISGVKMEPDAGGKKINYEWDKEKGWVETGKPITWFPTGKIKNGCSLPSGNSLIVDGSLISEDSYERFLTYGVNLSYIHVLSDRLGVMGDAGLYFGSQNQVDFTKLLVMGGICLKRQNSNAKTSFNPHLLAGVTVINSKNGTSSSNAYFTAAVGGDLVFHLSEKTGINARADYNPVFGNGNIATNIRLSAGLVLSLGQN